MDVCTLGNPCVTVYQRVDASDWSPRKFEFETPYYASAAGLGTRIARIKGIDNSCVGA